MFCQYLLIFLDNLGITTLNLKNNYLIYSILKFPTEFSTNSYVQLLKKPLMIRSTVAINSQQVFQKVITTIFHEDNSNNVPVASLLLIALGGKTLMMLSPSVPRTLIPYTTM